MSFILFILDGTPPYSVIAGAVTVFFLQVLLPYYCFLASIRKFPYYLVYCPLGYLHLVRAFLRCYVSLLRNSGLVQTVLALFGLGY